MKRIVSIIFAVSLILNFVGCKEIKEDDKFSSVKYFETERNQAGNDTVSIEGITLDGISSEQTSDIEADSENVSVEQSTAVEDKFEEQSQNTESKVVESTVEATVETTVSKFKSDAEVKAEIAKYVSTDIEFKLNKQEKINQKEFNLVFSEIDENHTKVIYKNETGDVFKFDVKSGILKEAIIDSLVTQKAENSIDKNTAQKVVVEYADTKYQMTDYKVYSYKETTKGHNFIYTKYIGGYPSTDKFSVKVGYGGNIVYISDFTDVFDGKEINYDKAFIDSKIKEHSDESKVDWNSVTICIYEDKVAVSYIITEKHSEMILPLE